MSLANYSGLKATLADWLDRSDMATRIPDFIRLAEKTLNKVLRSPRMVVTAAVPITANVSYATAPTDMLEPLFAALATDEDYPVEQVSPQQLTGLRRARLRASGLPRFFAIVGGRIELAPTPSVSGQLTFAYYQAIPPLAADGDTNWLLTYEPDIYLYASLLHAAQLLHDGAAAQRYESLLTQQISGAIATTQAAQMDGKVAGASLDTLSDPVKATPI